MFVHADFFEISQKHQEHPNIKRGLLIQKEWIDKILDKANPKTWEIRGKVAKLGLFYLVETRGGGIRGYANLVATFKTTKKDLNKPAARKKHKVSRTRLGEYVKQEPVVYVLEGACAYSITYKPKKGCVDWCVQDIPQNM
jgi:hypothetical protein